MATVLLLPQVAVFIYMLMGVMGAPPEHEIILPVIFLYEVGCIAFFFIWLKSTAAYLTQKLAAVNMYPEPKYFEVMYYILLASVSIVTGIVAPAILADVNNVDMGGGNTILSLLLGAAGFVTPYVFGGCFYFLFRWARSLEVQRPVSFIEALPYLLSIIAFPLAILLVQQKVYRLHRRVL